MMGAFQDDVPSDVAVLLHQTTLDVKAEFKRACSKHGAMRTPANPMMSNGERAIILGEEYGEVCRAMTYDEGDAEELEKELIQVATMALASVVGLRIARGIHSLEGV